MGEIEQLNERFALAGKAAIVAGEGGLPRVDVTADAASGSVYLHGAHVTDYRPSGGERVLFLSATSEFEAGKAIRGGVPICFPWFGPKADDPDAPSHGLVRTATWTLDAITEKDGAIVVTLTHRAGPYDLHYECVFGPSLTLTMRVTNTDDKPQRFEAALHSYLTVSDVRKVVITGLEDIGYFDKVADAPNPSAGEPILFTEETDRVYQDTTNTCVLHDPIQHRKIVVEKSGSQSTVVWNPWIAKAARLPDFGNDEWPGMCCIETACVEPNGITLMPGAQSHVATRITAMPM